MSKYTTSKILLFTLFAALFLPYFSHAAMAESNSTEQLFAIKDGETLTQEEKIALGRESVNKALDLSLEKVDKIEANLNQLSFPEDSREQELKDIYLSQLEEYRAHYTDNKATLGNLKSFDEIKNLAIDISKYREEVYSPSIEKMIEFILVFYTDNVINVANKRFTDISSDLKKLEDVGVIESGSFSNELSAINKLMDNARTLQEEAMRYIVVQNDVNASSTSTSTAIIVIEETTTSTDEDVVVSVNETATSTVDMQEEQISPRYLLETSLNNIKEVYSRFLDISKAVKEILGVN